MNISIGQNWLSKKLICVYSSSPLKKSRNKKYQKTDSLLISVNFHKIEKKNTNHFILKKERLKTILKIGLYTSDMLCFGIQTLIRTPEKDKSFQKQVLTFSIADSYFVQTNVK